MNWNDKDIEALRGLTGFQFEAARNKIISTAIASIPDRSVRNKVYAKQIEIDMQREKLTPEEFMVWLYREMAENSENAADQLLFLSRKLKSQ